MKALFLSLALLMCHIVHTQEYRPANQPVVYHSYRVQYYNSVYGGYASEVLAPADIVMDSSKVLLFSLGRVMILWAYGPIHLDRARMVNTFQVKDSHQHQYSIQVYFLEEKLYRIDIFDLYDRIIYHLDEHPQV